MEHSGYEQIGTLAKLHGFKGEYLLVTDNYFPKNIKKWESVFIEIDGLSIPFFISSLRIISESSAIIAFDDITTPEKAKEFVGNIVLQIATKRNSKRKLDTTTFEGYQVFDINVGLIGTVESIVEYSQNILFRILRDNQEILIPASEEYIRNIDPLKKELYLETPEGLLDLFK